MKDRIHFASGTAVDLPVDEAVDTLVAQIKAQFPEEEEPVLDLALVFLSLLGAGMMTAVDCW